MSTDERRTDRPSSLALSDGLVSASLGDTLCCISSLDCVHRVD